MSDAPTFKRSKRIIALHYGSGSFKTRRLCMLFPNTEGLSKNKAIIQEASRIITLRKSLGFEVTDAGIDAAMAIEVQTQKSDYIIVGKPMRSRQCVTCKHPANSEGWQISAGGFPVCAGDCALIACFYYTDKGSKRPSCASFKNKYGTAVDKLTKNESFDAMLSYMLHLTANRELRQQRYAQQRNPTHCIVQPD